MGKVRSLPLMGATTLRIATFSTMTLNITIRKCTTRLVTISMTAHDLVMLSVVYAD
jgi:hypothetical protein